MSKGNKNGGAVATGGIARVGAGAKFVTAPSLTGSLGSAASRTIAGGKGKEGGAKSHPKK
jgi:hypothetical protein